MSLSTNTTYRVFVEKLGGTDPAQFVGDAGEVFLDPSVPTLKLSDGSTAGGVEIGGGGGETYWVSTAAGIHTLSNVGVGTTNPTTKLDIGGVLGFVGNNVRIGDNTTGANLTSGVNNISMGIGAGNSTTTGSGNNFFGLRAGYSNISGSYNNFFGNYAGENNTGSYNVFFGPTVGRKNTGNYNVFFGAYGTGSNNTTGSYNVFFGTYSTGSNNTTGSYNVFFGPLAGNNNTTGSYNNFFGYQAGRDNISGSDNNAFGRSAGFQLTTGSYNNIFGVEAGYELRGGTHNILMGTSSGYYEEGDNNIFLGAFSGRGFVSGSPLTSGNILIGFGTAFNARFTHPDVTKSNQFAVGIRTDANPSKYWLVGDENFNVGIGTTIATSKLTVQNGDIKVGVNTSNGVILTDANGVAWRLIVNTDGTLATAAV